MDFGYVFIVIVSLNVILHFWVRNKKNRHIYYSLGVLICGLIISVSLSNLVPQSKKLTYYVIVGLGIAFHFVISLIYFKTITDMQDEKKRNTKKDD